MDLSRTALFFIFVVPILLGILVLLFYLITQSSLPQDFVFLIFMLVLVIIAVIFQVEVKNPFKVE